MTELDQATLDQNRAADPVHSTWLSANAGSGKTRVLTDRVARLLIEGVNPRHILCLTYTKAAAGEMQNRLFKRLGEWAMLPDAALRKQLAQLSVPADTDLDFARTLFAAAIETPGGLKIQTIHSFCSALLRRFPLEAGVSPDFTEADETSIRQLMAEIVDMLADGPGSEAVDGIASYYSGDDFDRLTQEVARHAEALRTPPSDEDVHHILGVIPGTTIEALVKDAFPPGTADLFSDVIGCLDPAKSTEAKLADALASVRPDVPQPSDLLTLEGVLLKKSGPLALTPNSDRLPTKATREAHPETTGKLHAYMDRIAAIRAQRIALAAAQKTIALYRFARAFLPEFARQKELRGWLSFDDLIMRAQALLSTSDMASWVLYRLDGGIDHILVDEAQDTSPAQWAVVERLAQEFTSGAGAGIDRHRTLFIVGDKKQSIYSFQGADAESFDRMRDHFSAQLADHSPLQQRELIYSFRSAAAVLQSVDATFTVPDEQDPPSMRHIAHKEDMPGRVDLWPLIAEEKEDDPPDFEDPVDRVSPNHHVVQLAGKVADEIKRLLDNETPIPTARDGIRKIRPGDILILVQKRTGNPSVFDEIIRALKARRLPVAGADRLKLRTAMAVKDILALLKFLALPEDSLSLAAALRSPLFGWSEAELYRLAANRTAKLLWMELRERQAEFQTTFNILQELNSDADFLRPYDLIERILIRHDGRRKLLDRLGAEAEDGIDELLNLALAYERTDIPSLTGFLAWIEAEDTEVKRQLESAGGRIRVMTVHGAKGLEAPVVILPDTVRAAPRQTPQIITTDTGHALWSVRADEAPAAIAAAIAARAAAQDQERQRLLYVAMTRAEGWLIVCGAGKATTGSWYDLTERGLTHLGAHSVATPVGEGLRYHSGNWPATAEDKKEGGPTDHDPLPEWIHSRVATPDDTSKPLAPSALGGTKALPGEVEDHDEEAALRLGRQIHLLLEHLPVTPKDQWHQTGHALLTQGEDATDGETAEKLTNQVATLLRSEDIAHVFAPETLAEVEVSADIPELGRRIHGSIDRLIVEPDRVLIVDYKSNRVVPETAAETPDGLLRQLGAYREALRQIYPDRTVDTAILWTQTGTLMPLPHDIVTKALGTTATS